MIAGSLFGMAVGVVTERLIIRHFYSRPHEDQLLVTFGLGIVFVETVRFIFGSLSKAVPAPWPFVGITNLGFMFYPTYRLALLGIVAVALIALYVVLYRTRIGLIVRAGIEDSVTVDSLGIDVYKIFALVFGIGAMAAGFAGIVNAPVVSIAPDVGEAILVQTFVVVVIGGVGSFPGAILGGLIAGEIISITSMFNPGYSYVMLFAAMTLVLVLRPHGLLGTAGRRSGKRCRKASPYLIESADRGRFDRGAVRAALSRIHDDHDGPHPGLGSVRHRIRHPFRVHRPALFRSIGALRHRRNDRRLSAGRMGFPDVTLALFIGMIGAAIVGYLVGLIALRRTGIYFAMITVAIAEVFFYVEFNPLSAFTGGENGMPGVPTPRSISASRR